jgi:hypothetical protein
MLLQVVRERGGAIQRAIEISRRWHRAGPESAGRAKLGDTFSLLHAEDF